MAVLTTAQWNKILDKGLVIRCDKTSDQCSGAAVYVMCMNVERSLSNRTPVEPENWGDTLKNTITFMSRQPEYDSCYLLIGDDVSSTSTETYLIDGKRTFPYVSVKFKNVLASTPIHGKSVDELYAWVIANI